MSVTHGVTSEAVVCGAFTIVVPGLSTYTSIVTNDCQNIGFDNGNVSDHMMMIIMILELITITALVKVMMLNL